MSAAVDRQQRLSDTSSLPSSSSLLAGSPTPLAGRIRPQRQRATSAVVISDEKGGDGGEPCGLNVTSKNEEGCSERVDHEEHTADAVCADRRPQRHSAAFTSSSPFATVKRSEEPFIDEEIGFGAPLGGFSTASAFTGRDETSLKALMTDASNYFSARAARYSNGGVAGKNGSRRGSRKGSVGGKGTTPRSSFTSAGGDADDGEDEDEEGPSDSDEAAALADREAAALAAGDAADANDGADADANAAAGGFDPSEDPIDAFLGGFNKASTMEGGLPILPEALSGAAGAFSVYSPYNSRSNRYANTAAEALLSRGGDGSGGSGGGGNGGPPSPSFLFLSCGGLHQRERTSTQRAGGRRPGGPSGIGGGGHLHHNHSGGVLASIAAVVDEDPNVRRLEDRLEAMAAARGKKRFALESHNAKLMERDRLRQEKYEQEFKSTAQLEAIWREALRAATEEKLDRLREAERVARAYEEEEEAHEYRNSLSTLHLAIYCTTVALVTAETEHKRNQQRLALEEEQRRLDTHLKLLEIIAKEAVDSRRDVERAEHSERKVLAQQASSAQQQVAVMMQHRVKEAVDEKVRERERVIELREAVRAKELHDAEAALEERMRRLDARCGVQQR